MLRDGETVDSMLRLGPYPLPHVLFSARPTEDFVTPDKDFLNIAAPELYTSLDLVVKNGVESLAAYLDWRRTSAKQVPGLGRRSVCPQ